MCHITDSSAIAENAEIDRIGDRLSRNYGLKIGTLTRIPVGQGTINFRAEGPEGQFFIKRYPAKANFKAEHGAIELSEMVRKSGVAAARPIANIAGQLLDNEPGSLISVWEWVRGEMHLSNLTSADLRLTGEILAKIHRALASHPLSRVPAFRSQEFLKISDPSVRNEIHGIMNAINERVVVEGETAFDQYARVALEERLEQLYKLPILVSSLPFLTSQVIHGDFTTMNLLFSNDEIAAVLDFRPPNPFLLSWELGRIAFNPDIVMENSNWLEAAKKLIIAYIDGTKLISPDDIKYSGRVALIQLMKSLYGVKQHYFTPALIQEDLDHFWRNRHGTVVRMLAALEDIDAMLQDLIPRSSAI